MEIIGQHHKHREERHQDPAHHKIMSSQKLPILNAYNQGAQKTYLTNKFYEDNVFNNIYYPYQLDQWKQKINYGLINTNGEAVIPRDAQKTIFRGANGNNITNLNFVHQAFFDMKEYHKGFYRGNKFNNKDSIYVALNPIETKNDAVLIYNDYTNRIFQAFVYGFLNNKNDIKISDLNTFMKIFINYMQDFVRSIPLTFSEFVKSQLCPIEASGLVISFDNKTSTDNTRAKADVYVSDDAFDAFVESARRYGFFVDKNAPWRIVADLGSPVMVEYCKTFGALSVDDVFNNFYIRAYELDIDIMINVLVNFWNSFTNITPVTSEISNISSCKNFFAQVSVNKKISVASFKQNFSINWVLRFYLFLKLLENGINITQSKFEALYNQSIRLNQYLNIFQSLNYINTTIEELKTGTAVATSNLTKPDEVAILLKKQADKAPYIGFNF